MDESTDIDARILIAGDPEVGKSSTFGRLANVPKEEALRTVRTFSGDTIAIQYEYPDGRFMTLEITDIPGDMDAGPIVRPYYRNLHGVLLVCDVTRPDTLTNLETRWLPEIKRFHTADVPPRYMLILNKYDVPDNEKKITEDEVIAFCKKNRVKRYVLSSAVTWSWATNPTPIEKFFLHVVGQVLLRRRRQRQQQSPDTIILPRIRLKKEETLKEKARDEMCSNCILSDERQ